MPTKAEMNLQPGDPFTCAVCGELLTTSRGSEECIAEMEWREGPKPDNEEICVVCHPCWVKTLEKARAMNIALGEP